MAIGPVQECPAFSACKELNQLTCFKCVQYLPEVAWKARAQRQINRVAAMAPGVNNPELLAALPKRVLIEKIIAANALVESLQNQISTSIESCPAEPAQEVVKQ